MHENRIKELEELLKVSERKSDILTNLLKEASAEYNQALEHIKVSEENFRTIINSVSECIITTDTEGTISMINRAGLNMFGYEDDEVAAHTIDQLFHDPGAKESCLRSITSGLNENWRAELAVITADDTVFPAQISLSGIKGADGENIGSVGVIRDISEEREVRRMKEDLVGMITHDMVNPILSLQRAIQLMIDRSLGPLEARQMEIMQLALSTTHQLFGMTNNLLDIYRNESGKFLLQLSVLDFYQIIQESVSQLRFFIKDKKLTLNQEPPPSPLKIHGDQVRLMRACVNLMDNAIRFAPEGSLIKVTAVRIDVENYQTDQPALPSRVREKLLAGQSYILVTFSDQGPGVPEKDKEAIFNKFFTTKVKGEIRRKGVGLGLTFCKLIIEAHHGEIWVESPVETDSVIQGQGCRFCFLLPAQDTQ